MTDFRFMSILGIALFYLGKQISYFVVLPPYRLNIVINTVVCLAVTTASTFLPRPEYALIGMTLGVVFYSYSNFRWTLTKDVTAYLDEETG